MAESKQDAMSQPRYLTEKEWEEYRKIRSERDELEKSSKGFYDEVLEAKTTIAELKNDFDEQKNRVRELEAERKGLQVDLENSHGIQKHNERLQEQLDIASMAKDQLTDSYEELKKEFVKLEHDKTHKEKMLTDADEEIEDLRAKVQEVESESKMHKDILDAYQEELQKVTLASDRLQELQACLQERSILGRKLDKDIADYDVKDIHKLLIEAMAEAGDGPESPVIRNSRQRGRNRQVSMQDELEVMGEELDGWSVESPSMVAVTPDGRPAKGSYFTSDLQRQGLESPDIDGSNRETRPTVRLDELKKSQTQTILSIEPTTPPVSDESTTTVRPALPTQAVRRVSSFELIQWLPFWCWLALLIGSYLLVRWVHSERDTWLAANELTRQAVIRLRENPRTWWPRLPARLVYDVEHFLGVRKVLMG